MLVLEALHGTSLAEWVRAELPPVPAFLEVAIQLSAALAKVHAAHLIHRDVTPHNVIVDPATRVTHLIDFDKSGALGSGSGAVVDASTAGFEKLALLDEIQTDSLGSR